MANADTPRGLRPIGSLNGSPYNGATIKCAILAGDGTATFIGDAVKLDGTASADGYYPSVVQAAATDEIFGVVTSFDANPDALSDQYRKATTLRLCNVVPALDTLFVIQVSGTFAITDVGEAADITVGSGNTTTGMSAMELEATPGTEDQVLILGIDRRPDNEVGAFADVIVRINESSLRGDGTPI